MNKFLDLSLTTGNSLSDDKQDSTSGATKKKEYIYPAKEDNCSHNQVRDDIKEGVITKEDEKDFYKKVSSTKGI